MGWDLFLIDALPPPFKFTFDEYIAVPKFILSSLQGFLYAPDGLPNNHPGLDQYFVPGVTPYALFPIVYFNHPDVHEAYREGKSIPQGHPIVMDLVRSSVYLYGAITFCVFPCADDGQQSP